MGRFQFCALIILPASSFQTQRFTAEPVWRPASQLNARELPHEVRPWLLDEGSLTARLVAEGGGTFAVQRLSQHWALPLRSEQRLLNLAQRHVALIREVELRIAGKAVVFARSVLPRHTVSGRLGFLRRLRNRPLGAFLFSRPDMHRTAFEVALLPGDSNYLPSHLHRDFPVWTRRSRFTVAGRSLMVSEVFLRRGNSD